MLKKATALFMLKMIGAGLSFLLYMLIGRKLGAEGAGIYFFALSISMIVATCSRLGMDNALLKYISKLKHNNHLYRCNGILCFALLISLISSVFVFIAFLSLKSILQQHMEILRDNFVVVQIFMVSVVFVSLFTLMSQALLSVGKNNSAIMAITVIPQFSAAVLTYLTIDRFGLYGAAISYLVGTIVSFLISIACWCWGLKGKFAIIFKRDDMVAIYKSSSPLFVASVSQISVQWASPLIAALFLSHAEIGALGVAARMAALMNFIFIAFNSIVSPKFSALLSENKKDEVVNLSSKGTTLMLLFSLPALLISCVFPSQIMGLFGDQFSSAGQMLVILVIGQFMFMLFGSSASLLIMSGNEKPYRNILLFTAICHVSLVYFLGVNYGSEGVCWGMSISLCLQNMISAIMAYKLSNIKWLSLSSLCGVKL